MELWKVWTQESFQKKVEFDRPGDMESLDELIEGLDRVLIVEEGEGKS